MDENGNDGGELRTESEDDVIANLFYKGFSYSEILSMLRSKYNINFSMITLKRRLNGQGLYRKKYFSDLNDIVDFISGEVSGSGQCHGYKWLHLKAVQNQLTLTQNMVRQALHVIDGEGMELRRRRRLRRRQYSSKGPNYTWHCDGYDKLKPYGFAISGCIDGYSRFILWLEVCETNNDSEVVAGYYLKTVESKGGCPITVRSDKGTENVLIERMQTILRENNSETNRPPYFKGASTANSRIESWWNILRREGGQFYMDIFGSLKDKGEFSGDFLDKSLLRYCFLEIIRKDLKEVVSVWNVHRIRRTKDALVPHGRPTVMYELPEQYGVEDCLVKVEEDDLIPFREICKFNDCIPRCDCEVFELCDLLLAEHALQKKDCTGNAEVAKTLYCFLRSEVRKLVIESE